MQADWTLEAAEKYLPASERARKEYVTDPLQRTQTGRINPVPQSMNQLKKARKQQWLLQIRKNIIYKLYKELESIFAWGNRENKIQ